MVIPSTGFCSFPCQELIEGVVHCHVFDNYVKLKYISGNAVLSCMLWYGGSDKSM